MPGTQTQPSRLKPGKSMSYQLRAFSPGYSIIGSPPCFRAFTWGALLNRRGISMLDVEGNVGQGVDINLIGHGVSGKGGRGRGLGSSTLAKIM